MTPTDIAGRFAAGRAAATGFRDYPGTLPATLAEAYAVQQAAIHAWDRPIAGWKIGRIAGPLEASLGENRFIGPIFADSVRAVADEIAPFPVIPDGFAALEAELVAVIGDPAPPGEGPWTAENCRRAVAGWHIGIEIAGSPLATINDLGPLASIAGFGNNIGLLLGAEVQLTDPDAAQCTVTIDNAVTGPARASQLPGGPLAAVAFALNKLAELDQPIASGMLLSTGAITGIHEVRAGQHCRAEFAPGGTIVCATEPIQRSQG